MRQLLGGCRPTYGSFADRVNVGDAPNARPPPAGSGFGSRPDLIQVMAKVETSGVMASQKRLLEEAAPAVALSRVNRSFTWSV
jgi:hypothetical protein